MKVRISIQKKDRDARLLPTMFNIYWQKNYKQIDNEKILYTQMVFDIIKFAN